MNRSNLLLRVDTIAQQHHRNHLHVYTHTNIIMLTYLHIVYYIRLIIRLTIYWCHHTILYESVILFTCYTDYLCLKCKCLFQLYSEIYSWRTLIVLERDLRGHGSVHLALNYERKLAIKLISYRKFCTRLKRKPYTHKRITCSKSFQNKNITYFINKK